MPGASLTTVTVSTPKPPESSLFEPARMMIATSSEPEPSSATLKPAAIDRSATSTSVTPPTPRMATSDEDQRIGLLRRFMPVTAPICANAFAMCVLPSDATQCVDDLEPHRRQRRPGARDEAEQDHQHDADDERARADAEQREEVLDRFAET